ncbi:MAG: tsaB [Burkholderiaceae bacterium]|nr:tsaB [Burkholderiaceae bacterium]
MATILALDTSTTLASAALLRDGQVLTRESSGVQTHSQMILPLLQELLAEAGVTLAQCDAIAVGIGPGSFTGVRTACGIAQGLAFGANLPVAPVVTLEAMAEACREANGASEVLTVLDAAMAEVYWAQYRFDNGWHATIAPQLSAPSAVMPQGKAIACGNGLLSYAPAFAGRDFLAGNQPQIGPHAVQVARLGQTLFAAGKMVAAHEAQPFYLRNKVALTTAERAAAAAKVKA